MRRLIPVLIILIISIQFVQVVQAGDVSRWQLSISGIDQLEFGTQRLAGGVQIEWQTIIEFTLQDGQFKSGTGTSRLLNTIAPLSRPPDTFNCQLSKGIFSNRNGMSFSTPHLRYKAFPVSGKVNGESIQLNPYLEYPGNYYAVLYHCQTSNELGSFWIERSPRIAKELSKRQNTSTKFENDSYLADIKEVKSIPPGAEIEFPLINGFKLAFSEQSGLRKLEYRLEKK